MNLSGKHVALQALAAVAVHAGLALYLLGQGHVALAAPPPPNIVRPPHLPVRPVPLGPSTFRPYIVPPRLPGAIVPPPAPYGIPTSVIQWAPKH